jgi:hypothetical protein
VENYVEKCVEKAWKVLGITPGGPKRWKKH